VRDSVGGPMQATAVTQAPAMALLLWRSWRRVGERAADDDGAVWAEVATRSASAPPTTLALIGRRWRRRR